MGNRKQESSMSTYNRTKAGEGVGDELCSYRRAGQIGVEEALAEESK